MAETKKKVTVKKTAAPKKVAAKSTKLKSEFDEWVAVQQKQYETLLETKRHHPDYHKLDSEPSCVLCDADRKSLRVLYAKR